MVPGSVLWYAEGIARNRRIGGFIVLRGYCRQGSLVAVTHNPELLSEADLVITLRGGPVARIQDRVVRTAQQEAVDR